MESGADYTTFLKMEGDSLDTILERIEKKLAMFCVGGSHDDNPDVEVMLQRMLTLIQ